jgi:hypothetical protein
MVHANGSSNTVVASMTGYREGHGCAGPLPGPTRTARAEYTLRSAQRFRRVTAQANANRRGPGGRLVVRPSSSALGRTPTNRPIRRGLDVPRNQHVAEGTEERRPDPIPAFRAVAELAALRGSARFELPLKPLISHFCRLKPKLSKANLVELDRPPWTAPRYRCTSDRGLLNVRTQDGNTTSACLRIRAG